jgi:hypothetical protein
VQTWVTPDVMKRHHDLGKQDGVHREVTHPRLPLNTSLV